MTYRAATLTLFSIGALVCLLFVWNTSAEFPMDDSYIHAIYAENLAQDHQLAFNRGEFAGIGATSILWVLVLSAGVRLGVDPLIFSRIVSVLCFCVAVVSVFRLSRVLFQQVLKIDTPWAPFAASFLFALSGNMIWFALSGMETVLFLSLALAALVLYQERHLAGMSVALALMTLTRTEGVVLCAILLTLYLIRTQRIGEGNLFNWTRPRLQSLFPRFARPWFPTSGAANPWAKRRLDASARAARALTTANVLLFVAFVVPWFLFLFTSTGHALPTSFAGKKLSQMAAMNYFVSRGPMGNILIHLKPIVFLVTWLFYALLFVFGGAWLPGPTISLQQVSGDLHLSLLGLVLFGLLWFWLIILGVRRVMKALPETVKQSTRSQTVLALFAWCVCHNLAYMILFPSLGTTSRYQASNHLILWLLVSVGLFSIRERPGAFSRKLFRAAFVFVFFFAVGNVFYWRAVYHANLEHMVHSRIAAAEYIDRELPKDSIVAAHDIGAVKYYCNRKVVDLGGLVDARFTDFQKRHAVDQYLRDQRVDYLVIPGKQSTEDEPIYDFLGFLGIKDSPMYQLREIASFEIDRERWALGNRPTGNYLPSVKVYKVNWTSR